WRPKKSNNQLPAYPIIQLLDSTGAVMSKKAAGKKAAGAAGRSKKYVYFFGSGKADGNRNMKDLLGGKGAGLAEMTNADLPVPPGCTVSTEVCNIYYEQKGKIPAAIDKEIAENIKRLEKAAGATLGSPTD